MDAKTSQTTSWDAIFSPPWALKGLNMVYYFKGGVGWFLSFQIVLDFECLKKLKSNNH
jgi:hypothetical protein